MSEEITVEQVTYEGWWCDTHGFAPVAARCRPDCTHWPAEVTIDRERPSRSTRRRLREEP